MTTSSSDHLRCLLLFAPKLLKSSHTLTAFPYLPLDLPSTYCYLPLPHCYTETALAKVSEAHVSFNLLNTSWYLSCLILGCLKCHWQLRTISHFGFCGLAASSPSFHQSYGSPSSPFSVSSFSAHPWNMEVLQGSTLFTLSPHTPERFHQHLGFSYILHSAVPEGDFCLLLFQYFLSSTSHISGDSICFSSEDLPLSLFSECMVWWDYRGGHVTWAFILLSSLQELL